MSVGGRWRSDTPPLLRTLEVWWVNTIILAYHDGQVYRTLEGTELPGITHWRAYNA
jgi:hypothetical protein